MRFVIVTGMSGGGKRTALKMLEDMGFFCVDNLPVALIDQFAEMLAAPGSEIQKVALGLDVRADQPFDNARKLLARLRENGFAYEILFMDASEATLVRRYKESRRLHPLAIAKDTSVEGSIRREREILAEIKKEAEYVIDTSKLLTRDLQVELNRIFVENKDYRSLMVNIISFGFKYGIPTDADLVFDVRFLPNPYYEEGLKYLTGLSVPVQEYVMKWPETVEFLDKLTDMLQFLIPNYMKEGKHQLIIGIGCTGGKHRSVTIANELYNRLAGERSFGLTVSHRDVK